MDQSKIKPGSQKLARMLNLNHVRSLRLVSQGLLGTRFVVSASAKSCLKYLKNCKTMDELKQIQTQIFMAGLHQNRETNYHLVAFCVDHSLGDFGYAEKILDYVQKPSLFLYNRMIMGYVKRDGFGRAVSLFERLREEGLSPDGFTYPFVVKAIGCWGCVWEGKRVHGLLVKSGLENNTYVCGSLIAMYGHLGELVGAQKVFDEMPKRVSSSWNVLICAYVRRGRFEDAIGVFRRMLMENNEKPDEATIVSTLSACTALKDLELGSEIHGYVRDKLGFSTIIYNVLLDMYVKCGSLSEAKKIFDEMPGKNVITLTSMVSGYIKCGELDKARELFQRYPIGDVILWTSLINGYVRCNRLDEAMLLFRVMQSRRVKADKVTMISLLTGCAQCGDLDSGEWIHGCVNRQGIELDGIVGTAIIDMYAKCGRVDKSLEVFEALGEKTRTAWTSIICGLARNSQARKALELFAEMKRAGISPDEMTFTGVLNACSHLGLIEEAHQLFYSMTVIHKIEPNLEHCRCLIDLFGRAGLLDEAKELVETLANGNNAIAVPLYGALLMACGINGNVELSEEVARRLEDIKMRDSNVQKLLSSIYASVEACEDVTMAGRKIRNSEVRKAQRVQFNRD